MLQLYPHNQEALDEIEAAWTLSDKACTIRCTGSGKAFITFALAQRHPNRRFGVLGPSPRIFQEQMKAALHSDPTFDASNIEFSSYIKARNRGDAGQDVFEHKVDMIVLDEFHHCGAPKWSLGVDYATAQNPGAFLLGMSATPTRFSDSGRDMSDELFDGKIIAELPLPDAWDGNIVPTPRYFAGTYDVDEFMRPYENTLLSMPANSRSKEAKRLIEEMRRCVANDMANIPEIMKRAMPCKDAHVIMFCRNIAEAELAAAKAPEWFSLVSDDVNPMLLHTKVPGKVQDSVMKCFSQRDGRLHVLIVVNMLNEGVHVPAVDAVVLMRPTKSPTIFQQQIGRVMQAMQGKVPIIVDLVSNHPLLEAVFTSASHAHTEYDLNGRLTSTVRMLGYDFVLDGTIAKVSELANQIKSFAVYDKDDAFAALVDFYLNGATQKP